MRPGTLAASIAPVLVGLGVGHVEAGGLHVDRAILALVVAVTLQVGANFANDYSDGVRGADAHRKGPARLTGSGATSPGAVRAAAFAFFAVAALAGTALSWRSGHLWLVGVGALAIAAAWFYTGGARPYGYAGLGEVGVFTFFGLVAALGTAYTQEPSLPWTAWCGAAGTGVLACAILMANNLRDIPTDRKAGKKTLAVRLGDRKSRRIYTAQMLVAFACVAPCAVANPRVAAVFVLLIPTIHVIGPVQRGARGADLIPVLKRTAQIDLGFGLLLGLALALAAR